MVRLSRARTSKASSRGLDEDKDVNREEPRGSDVDRRRIVQRRNWLPPVLAGSGLPSNQDPAYAPVPIGTRNNQYAAPEMGTHNARVNINAALRATTTGLNEGMAGRLRNSKRKLSLGEYVNPPYRMPTEHSTSSIARRLVRASTNAIVGAPDKRPQQQSEHAQGLEGTSLLRGQPTTPKQVPSSPAVQFLAEAYAKDQQRIEEQLFGPEHAMQRGRATRSSPRKSRLQQERTRQAAVQEKGAIEEREAQVAHETAIEAVNTQIAHVKNWFRDRFSYIDDGNARDAGAAASVEPDAESGAAQEDEQERTEPELSPRKRGGPAKHSSSRAQHGQNSDNTAGMEPSRRSRRLRHIDVDDGASTPARPSIEAHGTEEPGTSGNLRRPHATVEAHVERGATKDDESLFVPQEEEGSIASDDDDGDAGYVDTGGDDEDDILVDDDELPENPIVPHSKNQAEPSDLPAVAPEDASKVQDGPETAHTPKKRRREASEEDSRNPANTSKKRKRFSTPAVEGAEPSLQSEREEEPSADNHRFYSQWRTLCMVFKAPESIGVNHRLGKPEPKREIELSDAEVGVILNVCNEAIEKLERGKDPAAEFVQIGESVDALHQGDDEFEPDFHDEDKSKNIYAHLFPKLVELLRVTIETYESADKDTSPSGPLTIGHLAIVTELIRLILDLGQGMTQYVKPPSALALVQPVKNGIIAKLKTVDVALQRVLFDYQRDEEYKKRGQQDAEALLRSTQQEEQEERRAAHVRQIRNNWHQLHVERMWAEGGIMSRQKRAHLKEPDPQPEYDGNGRPFERLEVFIPRIGPPPALVEEARARVWPIVALDALVSGLKKYAGPDVFWKTIREHCGRKGPLHEYNVTEIVTTAADLKEYLTSVQQEQNGQVDDWVKAIPVWTKGHPLGKENTDDMITDNDHHEE